MVVHFLNNIIHFKYNYYEDVHKRLREFYQRYFDHQIMIATFMQHS